MGFNGVGFNGLGDKGGTVIGVGDKGVTGEGFNGLVGWGLMACIIKVIGVGVGKAMPSSLSSCSSP